jgi:xanthine dehydrogenase accessory factor
VEEVEARRAETPAQALDLLARGILPVLADPEGACIKELRPDVVIDAILAKVNTGTAITDAPVVIAVGPGFTAGVDCHAVVETKRGHTLGRVILSGSAIPNTGVPGLIGGYAAERVMHSANAGVFRCVRAIGDSVEAGETVAYVGETPLKAAIPGILRGLLPEGFAVPRAGFKCADVDPRGDRDHCFSASDKAIAVGGGVLEALLALTGALRDENG